MQDRNTIRETARQMIRDTNMTTTALVCLTPNQKEALQARAKTERMSLSEYIRWFLFAKSQ